MTLRKAAVVVACYGAAAFAAVGLTRFYTPVRVVGGSMEPALRSGDMVLVSDAAPEVRDIVLLEQPGHGPVLHRVVGRRAGLFVTRGDANPTDDRTLARPEWVRGRVAVVVPAGRAVDRLAKAAHLR